MFPKGWFFIQSSTNHNHALTVDEDKREPGSRVELRPLALRNNQLWSYDDGFLINKHSGCVIGLKQSCKSGENLFATARQARDTAETQLWQLEDNHLSLISFPKFSVSDQQVPRMIKATDNTACWICTDEITGKACSLNL